MNSAACKGDVVGACAWEGRIRAASARNYRVEFQAFTEEAGGARVRQIESERIETLRQGELRRSVDI